MATFTTGYALGAPGSEQMLSANDANLDQAYEDLVKEGRTAAGSLVRYKIAKKLHFAFRYDWLQGHHRDVPDGGMGRNDLLALYQADAVMNLITPSDQNGSNTYSVRFVASSWRETPMWRYGDATAWRLSFELVEA